MPRYYFHVKRGQVTVLDHDGVELANFDEAIKEAARRAEEIASTDFLQGITASSRSVTVADDNWRKMIEFPF